MLRLVLFVVPLGLDTFAVSAALGLRGAPREGRLRLSLVMSGFELAMPLVGVLLGAGLGRLIGGAAGGVAIGLLALVGGWMLVRREEAEGLGRIASGSPGLALVALGLSISLDELAIGFTIGLLRLPLWLAVVLIGAQAFAFAQLGFRVGTHLHARLAERAEELAGLVLLGLAVLLLVERLR